MLSLIYDKDLGAKVFQLRDSERYTNSTQTFLELSYANSRRDYVTVTMTASVKKNLGRSSVAFYRDDELVGVVTCNQGIASVSSTTKSSYGYHKYYAKYLGNAQCLSSKSAVTELTVDEPDLPKSVIGLAVSGLDSNLWVESLPNLTLTLKQLSDDTAITGKTINIYVNDDEPISYTLENESGNIKSVLSDYLNYVGQLNIRVEFEGDVEYLGNSAETKFYVGYDLTATPNYSKIGSGDTVTVDVSLSKQDGTPVADKTIRLNG